MKHPPQEFCTLPWGCPTSAFPVLSFLFLCKEQTRTRKWLGSRLKVRLSPSEWLTNVAGWSEHLHCRRERVTILSPPSAEKGFKSGFSLHVLDSCCRLLVWSGFYCAEYFTRSLGLETGPVVKKACCWVWFPVLTSGNSQPPATSAPADLISLAHKGTCTLVRIPILRHRHIL